MNQENSYLVMENSLLNNLRPVQPRPDFIKNLGKRLLGSNNIYLEDRNHGFAFVLISLGLFVGALLVWLFRKHG
jgi:hypothetical protein